jgi:hypothetical protein
VVGQCRSLLVVFVLHCCPPWRVHKRKKGPTPYIALSSANTWGRDSMFFRTPVPTIAVAAAGHFGKRRSGYGRCAPDGSETGGAERDRPAPAINHPSCCAGRGGCTPGWGQGEKEVRSARLLHGADRAARDRACRVRPEHSARISLRSSQEVPYR